MTEKPPIQVQSPSLVELSVNADKQISVATIEVSSQGQRVVITIVDPHSLPNGERQSESDIRTRFNHECTMLNIQNNCIEFWGHDGFLSSIRGTKLCVTY